MSGPPCPYFLKGHCRKGTDCPLRHTADEAGPAAAVPGAGVCAEAGSPRSKDRPVRPRGRRPCPYFQRGNCRNGDQCKMAHEAESVPPEAVAECAGRGAVHDERARVSARPCPYFLKGNCRNGDECRLSHSTSNSNSSAPQPCRFFLRGTCRNGDRCRDPHVSSAAVAPAAAAPGPSREENGVGNPQARGRGGPGRGSRTAVPAAVAAAAAAPAAAVTNPAVSSPHPVPITESTSPQAADELRLARTLFRDSFVEVGPSCRFSVLFKTTDPDFPYRMDKGLELVVTFPRAAEFPLHSPSVELRVIALTARGNTVPYELAQVVEQAAQRFVTQPQQAGKPVLRALLRFLDRSLGQLVELARQLAAKNQAELLAAAQRPAAAAAAGTGVEERPSAEPSPAPPKASPSPAAPPGDEQEKAGLPPQPWTAEEQQLLEKALVATQACSPPSERWDQVSKLVPGRSKAECVARFKAVRDALRMQQQREAELEEQRRLQREESAEQADGEGDDTDGETDDGDDDEGEDEDEDEDEDESEDDEGEDEGEDDFDGEGDAAPPAAGSMDLNPQHTGWHLELVGVDLRGVALVKPSLVPVQGICGRCGTLADFPLEPSKVCLAECAQCSTPMGMRLRPQLLHPNNAALGYVDVENCETYDLLPFSAWLTCSTCMNDTLARGILRGTVREESCVGCHSRLAVQFSTATFAAAGNPKAQAQLLPRDVSAALANRRAQARRAAAGPPLVGKLPAGVRAGQPLPEKGACRHYRRSYRWFRFPCCGKAFPCDECHEAANADGHPVRLARTQLCGACSREQPVTNKACSSCGFEFSAQTTRHWEGGSGCRDRARMSRNDPKKHRGLTKTVSRKASALAAAKAGKKKKKKKSTN